MLFVLTIEPVREKVTPRWRAEERFWLSSAPSSFGERRRGGWCGLLASASSLDDFRTSDSSGSLSNQFFRYRFTGNVHLRARSAGATFGRGFGRELASGGEDGHDDQDLERSRERRGEGFAERFVLRGR